MTEPSVENEELKGTGYEIFIAALSILSIFNLVLLEVIQEQTLDLVIAAMNLLLSLIFLIDFSYRLLTAPSKFDYFFREYGWADLLASLPFERVKILRLFRLIRVFRLLRKNGEKAILRTLVKDRAESALLTLLLIGILVLEFGSLWILGVEENVAGANITTASDAIWYVVATISTVGYGDQYPITNEGRLIGTMIIVVGVGIFGTFTGYLANLFIAPKNGGTESTKASTPSRLPDTDDETTRRVAELEDTIARQQATMDEILRLLKSSGG